MKTRLDAPSQRPAFGFVVWPQRGHIYPTLYLAKRLREGGAEIFYFGGESGRALVEEQGFSYQVILPEAGSSDIPQKLDPAVQRAFLAQLVDRFSELLRRKHITHLFVDPLIHLATLSALNAGIMVSQFWVMNPAVFRGRHRPFGLGFSLHHSRLARAAPQLLWIPELIRSNFWLARFYPRRAAANQLINQAAATHRLKRVLTSYGYQLDLPTLVLGPEQLAHWPEPSLTYLGLGVEPSRSEPDHAVPANRKLVYCSLGSNFALYERAVDVIREVVCAAASLPEFDFIIQAPKDGVSRIALPPNVGLVERAATLKIMARASVAITHAGYGGVKESIYYAVPSLSIPFLYDQPANAALLAARGLGLALSPRRATATRIRTSLTRLIGESRFRASLEALRACALIEDRYDRYCAALLEPLTART